ncbi:ankyrin [Calocera cornea HHB12733]|uniref:Ankyrin n=1 Tax=Calocera cornea HHB12733 TaxID=1353952 RepID=A0A165GH61_9BASI|nr:ankyrin [Calocera cornea HHB12733]
MSGLDIHKAALEGQKSLVASLLSSNPSLLNSKDVDGRTPLHWASTKHKDVVEQLLSHNPPADVNVKDTQGWTPLMIAASAGQDDIVELLIGAGADVKAVNEKGITALHYAASKGRYEIGKLLVAAGADAPSCDNWIYCVYQLAASTASRLPQAQAKHRRSNREHTSSFGNGIGTCGSSCHSH